MRPRGVAVLAVAAVVGLPAPPAAALDSTLTAVRADPFTSQPVLADGTPLDGSGVTIAVVDSGVDGTHPMFVEEDGTSAVVRNLETVCTDDVAVVGVPVVCELVDVPTNDSDTTSLSGHGTAVASIAVGRPYTTSTGIHLQGVAPGAEVVAISTGAVATGYAPVQALEWVLEHHADPCGDGSCPPIRVVNASFTTSDFDEYPPEDPVSVVQEELLAAGVTIVWGAGNSGGDGSTIETNPWGQTPTAGAIMVGSVDDQFDGRRDGPVSSFSSRGLRGRPETYPDLVAPGGLTTWACRPQLVLCGIDPSVSDPNVGALGGTSASAPYVSGAVALLLQAAPELTPAELEHLLERTAHRSGDTTWEPDPAHVGTATSHDRGHGLLDVGAAIRELEGRDAPDMTRCATPSRDASGDVRLGDYYLGVPRDAPDLDVLAVHMAARPDDAVVEVALELDDLDAGSLGSYAVSFDVGDHEVVGQEYALRAVLAGGPAVGELVGPGGSTAVPVRVDDERDLVTWQLPYSLEAVGPAVDLGTGQRVTDVHGTAARDDVTDTGTERCAFRVAPDPAGTVVRAVGTPVRSAAPVGAGAPPTPGPVAPGTALVVAAAGAAVALRRGQPGVRRGDRPT